MKDRRELSGALWSEGEGLQERVAAALPQAKKSRRQRVLDQLIPLIPSFKNREAECGGPYDRRFQVEKLVMEILGGTAECPTTVDDLISDIKKRVSDMPCNREKPEDQE